MWRAAAIYFGVLVALRFLWVAHAVFIVAILGVLAGLTLVRPVDWLERRRVRRGLGAPFVVLALIGLLVGLLMLVAPSIQKQTAELAKDAPQAIRSIEKRVGAPVLSQIARELRSAPKVLFPIVSSIIGAIGGLLIILMIALYIAVDPETYREGIVHLVPHQNRKRAREVLINLAETLREWLFARLLAMLAIGAITGIALAIMRVKGAIALGIIAGLLEMIPVFGPIVSAIPAVAVALSESPSKAMAVVILYVIVQQLEGHVVTPLLMKNRLDVPPVLTIVAVTSFGVVAGVPGMLIAEPIIAGILVVTKMLYVQDVVGDDVSVGKEDKEKEEE